MNAGLQYQGTGLWDLQQGGLGESALIGPGTSLAAMRDPFGGVAEAPDESPVRRPPHILSRFPTAVAVHVYEDVPIQSFKVCHHTCHKVHVHVPREVSHVALSQQF
jgi:hypothetical protein